MNDEINKIIQSISDFYKLDNALKYYLDRHKAHLLLDYITNLQEEKEDYKSRCEKAIDKISKLKPFIPNEIPSWIDELENILNGGDKE